jgi:hypothetical protein
VDGIAPQTALVKNSLHFHDIAMNIIIASFQKSIVFLKSEISFSIKSCIYFVENWLGEDSTV